MKQIKTVYKDINPRLSPASEVQEFDDAVNAALAEGWTLVNRGVLGPHVGEIYDYNRTFYAELEREIVERAEEEQAGEECDCGNCRYYGTAVYDFPCTDCKDCDKWEPKP